MGSCWCKALKVSNRILNLIRSFTGSQCRSDKFKWSDVVVFAGAFSQAGGSILLIEAFSKQTAHYAKKSSSMSSLEDTKAWSRISVISVIIAIFLCGKCYAHGIRLIYRQLKWVVKNDTDILAESDG